MARVVSFLPARDVETGGRQVFSFLPAKGRAGVMPLQLMEMRLLVKVKGQVVEEGVVKLSSSLSLSPSPSTRTPSTKPGRALYGLDFTTVSGPSLPRSLVRSLSPPLSAGQYRSKNYAQRVLTSTGGFGDRPEFDIEKILAVDDIYSYLRNVLVPAVNTLGAPTTYIQECTRPWRTKRLHAIGCEPL